MRIAVIILFLVAAAVVVCLIADLASVRYVTLFYPEGIQFVGRRSLLDPLDYFSLRVENGDGMPSSIGGVEIYVKINGKQYPLPQIEAEQLLPLAPTRYSDTANSDGRKSVFFLDRDQKYAIDFDFRNGILCKFYMNKDPQARMPISLELGNGRAFDLPITHEELVSLFGEPARVESMWGT
jgi:hypothetical protein